MRLEFEFFDRECTEVAEDLVGKNVVYKGNKLRILETEAYCGLIDTACHAYPQKRTPRTEPLFHKAGTIYIYLCYGIHWLLNVSTNVEGVPQGVLIRSCVDATGPGKLTKKLGICDKSANMENVSTSKIIWFEDDGFECNVKLDTRVGIGYADEIDQQRLWRFKGDF
ncbi:MAG: hypothetical protein ATN36_08630 [Epulopiscium sp. Nele67-Bin005]|nr:MAG: hypothetical protein ATN36_08630 [Epulopiscium sp. Nele67-Bin005]